MEYLTFLLFVILVDFSIIDVGAMPADEEVRLDLSSSWIEIAAWAKNNAARIASTAVQYDGADLTHDLLLEVNRVSKSFNREEIQKALDPLDRNIKLPDIFARILKALKKKNLGVNDAEGFAERLCLLNQKYKQYGYFIVFKNIVEIFGIYEKNDEQDFQELQIRIQKSLDLFLYPNTKALTHFTSTKLAPLVTELIRSMDDNAEDVSGRIAQVLTTDKGVSLELSHVFTLGTGYTPAPYSLATHAMESTRHAVHEVSY